MQACNPPRDSLVGLIRADGGQRRRRKALPRCPSHTPGRKANIGRIAPYALKMLSPTAAMHEWDTQFCLYTEVSYPTHTRLSSKCTIQMGGSLRKLPKKSSEHQRERSRGVTSQIVKAGPCGT